MEYSYGVISLCDYTGEATRPWREAGIDALHVDPQREDNGTILEMGDRIAEFIATHDIRLVMGFPPCTDVATAGARYFEAKRQKDIHFQAKAALVAEQCRMVGILSSAPWFFENPVSVFSSIFGKPDATFDPFEYGGYIEDEPEHPRWPNHIPPLDAYKKKTCLWTGGGFELPPKKPVPLGEFNPHEKTGGKSRRTKNIRSATPRGFARALFEMYKPPGY